MKSNNFSSLLMAASAALVASARADVNSALATWNVVTVSNAYLNDPVQGNAFVGGNLTYGNTVGGSESAAGPANDTLVVGGNIQAWTQVMNGSAYVGGGLTGGGYVALANGGTLHTGSPVPAAVSPVASLIQNSLYWSTLTPNGTATSGTGSLALSVAPTSSSVGVIDITGDQSFGANLWSGLTLSLPANVSTVIINVDGGNINETYAPKGAGLNGNFAAANVIYNFYDATNVTLTSTLYGHIIAPLANVSLGNAVYGGVVASNLNSLGGAGVVLPTLPNGSAWSGNAPVDPGASPTPEPATLALLPAGALLLWRLRRK